LMKMRGWPRGPPPPSHLTDFSLTQRTGCLWMSSMAANGRGCVESCVSAIVHPLIHHLLLLFVALNSTSILFLYSVLLAKKKREIPYLIIHDHLLKSRSHHSFLSGLLATAPHTLPVGRLHTSTLFALGNRLLQWLIHVAFAACRGGIGAADG
jgi:hypothetical protein